MYSWIQLIFVRLFLRFVPFLLFLLFLLLVVPLVREASGTWSRPGELL
jgi:hypothetical protein